MSRPAAPALALLLAAGALVTAATARAEEIDDPKVARRLGSRVVLPGAAVPVAGVEDVKTPAAEAGPPPALAEMSAPGPAVTVARQAAPPQPEARTITPRVKLGYRRFDFVRIGATDPGSTTGNAATEPFNCLSLDIYPISSFVRFGLSTQYAWESGAFGGSGDYFVAQSFSLGGQLPGRWYTPFAEAFGGGGYMRRFQFDRTVPTVYWHLGIDAGAELYVAPRAFVSLAIGYLHPVNGFAKEQTFASVFVDTWSFKIGFGI